MILKNKYFYIITTLAVYYKGKMMLISLIKFLPEIPQFLIHIKSNNMRQIFLFILFSIPGLLNSSEVIDSLKAELAKIDNNKPQKIHLYNRLAFHYWRTAPDSTIYYALQAEKLNSKFNIQAEKGWVNINLGLANWVTGNYPKALDYHQKALPIMKKVNDTLGIIQAYLNLGLVYGDQNYHKDALQNYEKALVYVKESDNFNIKDVILNNIGSQYYRMGKPDLALQYFKEALDIRLSKNYQNGISESLNNIGIILMEQGSFTEALDYQKRSLDIREAMNDNNGIAMTEANIGKIYTELNDYENAEKHFFRSIEVAKDLNSIKILNKVYFYLSNLEKKRDNYKKALEYYTTFDVLSDSIYNQQKLKQFFDLEKEYLRQQQAQELIIQQQKLNLQEKEAKYARLWHSIALGGMVLLILAIILIFIYQKRKINRTSEFYKIKEARAKAELQLIKLKEQELHRELEFKNRELSSYTLNFIRKKELFEELQRNINQLKRKYNNAYSDLKGLTDIIREGEHLDKDWEDFKIYFEQVHQDFFDNLKHNFPDLTNGDLKLCALLKMNLNLKEAATILGISPNSVKTARYRLRKKFNLGQDDNLVEFILSFDSKAALN